MKAKLNRVIYHLWHNQSETGKIGYIGKDSYYPKRVNLNERAKDTECPKLYNAFQKYPKKFWFKEVLASGFRSTKSLNKAEKFYIKKFDSVKYGYNCTTGGDGALHSNESKALMSRLATGKRFSEEVKQQMSKDRKGKQTGKDNSFYGKKHTPATKAKMRAAKLGKPLSPECKEKLLIAVRNPSLETRIKFSKARKGVKLSEEVKTKISEAIKLWWAKRKSDGKQSEFSR